MSLSASAISSLNVDHDEGGCVGYRGLGVADLRARNVPAEVILGTVKAALCVAADARAEALRMRLITPGTGQAMEYQEAYAQAVAVEALTVAPDPAAYPMLAVTIGVEVDPQTGEPATDVLGIGRSVRAGYDGYLRVGAAIRGARLACKAAINAVAVGMVEGSADAAVAADPAQDPLDAAIKAACAVLDGFAWPDLP